jgi:integrase
LAQFPAPPRHVRLDAFGSVIPLDYFVTVRPGWRAIPIHKAASTSVNVTVGRGSREYLTEREVERLIEAAKQNRSGHRDATAILVAYRHGLRASELVALRWDDIELTTGRLHVRRAKSVNRNLRLHAGFRPHHYTMNGAPPLRALAPNRRRMVVATIRPWSQARLWAFKLFSLRKLAHSNGKRSFLGQPICRLALAYETIWEQWH